MKSGPRLPQLEKALTQKRRPNTAKKQTNKQKTKILANNTIHNCSKEMKFLSINLTKPVQNLYAKNYKTLIKETEEDLNKWENIVFVDWKTRHGKVISSPQADTKFNTILIKSQ